jgi:DNA-binding CsgD family transcriptional regulator
MSDEKAEMFGKSSVEDLARGYVRQGQDYVCLHCEARFDEGLVYPIEGGMALAERAARDHVEKGHGGAFEALMRLGPEAAGLTELQGRLLRYLHEGKGDRDIAAALGGKSESTVRNHRFNLRKRSGEARIFLALMGLVESPERASSPEPFLDYPAGMPLRDERTAVTASEAAAIEARCLRDRGEGGIEIIMWPRKQKEKLVVLLRVAGLFERGRMYSEQEVNAVLMPVYGDHVTIRRYLIEYRLLDRRPDGSAYWRS